MKERVRPVVCDICRQAKTAASLKSLKHKFLPSNFQEFSLCLTGNKLHLHCKSGLVNAVYGGSKPVLYSENMKHTQIQPLANCRGFLY
jgi:hypothetical protein